MSIDRDCPLPSEISRRAMLWKAYNGLGGVALSSLLAQDIARAAAFNPLTPKPQHFPAKAKNCIFLYMSGGVSQMDTFDFKPELNKLAGKPLPTKIPGVHGQLEQFLKQQNPVLPIVFPFERRGQSGRLMSVLFEHMGKFADDFAFVHGIMGDSNNHGPSTMHVNTGSVMPGAPSVGAWVAYGLGSENQNLPGYLVLHDHRGGPVNGAAVWQNGYLPAAYQGTVLRPSGTPILNLASPPGVSKERTRAELDLLRWMNEKHAAEQPARDELEARIAAYELAFRMQTEAPAVMDISQEPEHIKKLYGLDNPVTESYGRQCLLARRLVEQGVRFTLLIHGHENGFNSWDNHREIKHTLLSRIREVDKPIAGLLTDLKQRGLFDETLVVWTSEMGRTPFTNPGQTPSPAAGRNHNQFGMVSWFAGGGVKGGADVGMTDDFGLKAVGEPIPMRDMHATLLYLLGLKHE